MTVGTGTVLEKEAQDTLQCSKTNQTRIQQAMRIKNEGQYLNQSSGSPGRLFHANSVGRYPHEHNMCSFFIFGSKKNEARQAFSERHQNDLKETKPALLPKTSLAQLKWKQIFEKVAQSPGLPVLSRSFFLALAKEFTPAAAS